MKKPRENEALVIGIALSAMTLYMLNNRRRKRAKYHHATSDNDEVSSNSTATVQHQQEQQQQHQQHQQGLADDQIPPHMLRERVKEKRRQFKLALLSMKSPLYDNIDMLDPHGTLLCKVSARKAKWYISKELADWVEGEGVDRDDCLQLRFEPKKRSHSDNKNDNNQANPGVNCVGDTSALYSKAVKKNVCVACGEAQNLVRHYIVPYAYRVLMPIKYKSHMSHDIVILCCYCNIHCDKGRRMRIEELEDVYKPPQGYKAQFENNQRLYKIRSAALALKNWADKMPKEKVMQHESMVRSYLQEREHGNSDTLQKQKQPNNDSFETLTPEDLRTAIDVEYRVENPNFVSSHQVVVTAIVNSGEEGVSEFVKGWRQHFLDTVQPQFMPVGWSVDNSVSCDSP